MRNGEAFEGILRADGAEQATNVFRDYLAHRGFQNIMVGDGVRPLVWEAPKGWLEYYHENGLQFSDPVWRAARYFGRAHTWALPLNIATYAEQKMLAEGEDAGLRCGVSIPICDSTGLHANISVSSREKDAAPEHYLDEIAAVGMAFSFKSINSEIRLARAAHKPLTPKERECVQWASVGKTYNDIADIMMISQRTVVTHIVHAMDKFGAANITSLCVMALMSKDIDPPT